MAAGWWTVLKTVPWSEVISAAPQVATGARRLWDTVNRKSGSPVAADSTEAGVAPDGYGQEHDIVGLIITRLDQTDAEVNELRNQMRSASELIANLADQNAQLIAKMDAQRQKMVWLGATAGVSALLALAALILVSVRTWQ